MDLAVFASCLSGPFFSGSGCCCARIGETVSCSRKSKFMVGILGDRSAMGVDGRNCAGNWGVVGRDRSSTGDVFEAEDFLDEDDSNLVRLFFFFRGFTAAAGTPVGLANGSPIPLLSIAISYWFSQSV